ncbi:unnamed protein product [Anisakis simplex]|uniref:Uncharacterized protein n=1 Tax=Anisakis simplex TaxID=6269 RepID=A0A3P6QZU7_ANISI|nr:unnamed protein product [Anisakis simplex]
MGWWHGSEGVLYAVVDGWVAFAVVWLIRWMTQGRLEDRQLVGLPCIPLPCRDLP